jgi:zinc transporter ZupT
MEIASCLMSRHRQPAKGRHVINITLQLILRSPAMVARLPSLSAGLLLGAALLYALPQAFESTADKRGLCATLLAGLLSFFLLEKCATLFLRRRAHARTLLCSSLAAAAGLAGYLALERGLAWMPYLLVLASSGFLYIALSELVPKIQQPASWRDTIVQLLLLGIGVTVVLTLPGPGASH